MKKDGNDAGYYFYSKPDTTEGYNEESFGGKADFGIKDIIAMIIAAFELVFPPLFIMFGVVLAIYLVLKLVSGF